MVERAENGFHFCWEMKGQATTVAVSVAELELIELVPVSLG